MANLENLLDDFEAETGVKLDWIEDSEDCEDEILGGSTPDTITYTPVHWEERFALVRGFSFKVGGITISGRLKHPLAYGVHDADSGDWLDKGAEQDDILKAIREVCGRINYGETALADA